MVICCAATRVVSAQGSTDEPPLSSVGPADYWIAGGALALAGLLELTTEPPARGSYGAAPFLDDPARSALRLHTASGRNLGARLSDAGFYLLVLWPLLVDPAVMATTEDAELAWRLFVVHLESLAVAGALTRPAQRLGRRDRPLAEPCRQDPDYHGHCDSGAESLASGHVAIAFAGASALCGSHLALDTYGGGAVEHVTCGSALTLATLTAVLRVSSDMHWATDVLLGAAMGGAAGALLPWLMHYRELDAGAASVVSIMPFASSQGAGIGMAGRL
jgi:membrane-associated phospholipid phosphatase